MEKKKYISYAITACNEYEELNILLNVILNNKRIKDEVIVLLDENKYTTEIEFLIKMKGKGKNLKYYKYPLDNHFGNFKNKLNEYCTKDYIFQIDADEYPSLFLMKKFSEFLGKNDVDLYRVPRLNLINNMSEKVLDYITKMNWNLSYHKGFIRSEMKEIINKDFYNIIKNQGLIYNESNVIVSYYVPIINFPDYQARIYKNNDNIKWSGKVHETITGHSTYYNLPIEKVDYCLMHQKSFEKQISQNEFYNKL